jgi:hypothetical protein
VEDAMTLRSLRDLMQNPELMKPPEIIAPPVGVAGRVTLLSLGPKKGKSTTVAGMIAQASQRGVPCALLTLDEDIADTLQRLIKFGADVDRVLLDNQWEPPAMVGELIAGGLKLLAVDFLGKLAERDKNFGPNSQGDPILWGRLVAPFAQLARDHGIAVVLIDQARRSDGEWSGSVGKGGGVDIIATLLPTKDKLGLESRPIGRINVPPFRVDLDSEGCPVFSDADGGEGRVGGTGKLGRGDALSESDYKAVFDLLADAEPEGYRSSTWAGECKSETGRSKATFNRIRKYLLEQGLISHVSRIYHVTGTGTRRFQAQCVSKVPEVSKVSEKSLDTDSPSRRRYLKSLTDIKAVRDIPVTNGTLDTKPGLPNDIRGDAWEAPEVGQ